MSSSRLMARRGEEDGAKDEEANDAGSPGGGDGEGDGEGAPDLRRFCNGDGRKTVLFGFFSSSSPVIARFP
jgi:hypothetical protein